MSEEQVENVQADQQTQHVDNQNQPIDQNITQDKHEQQEINWRKFREAREQERKQREEAERRATQKEAEARALKEAMDALLNKPSQSHDQYDEDDEEVRIQKKIDAALAAKERQYEEERKKREKAEMPVKLKQACPDFERVCTTENLDYLEFHHPEIASAFNYMPDGVEKWSTVYKAIKKFVPNTSPESNRAKIERNLSKPQAMATSGVAQTGDVAPIYVDERRKADNWARMQKVMRGF